MRSVVDEMLEDYPNENASGATNKSKILKEEIVVRVYYNAKFNGDLRKNNTVDLIFDFVPNEQEIIEKFKNNEEIVRLKNWSFSNLKKKIQNDPKFWNDDMSGWKDFKITGYDFLITVKTKAAIDLGF